MSADGAGVKGAVRYNITVHQTTTSGLTGPAGMSSAPTHALLRYIIVFFIVINKLIEFALYLLTC